MLNHPHDTTRRGFDRRLRFLDNHRAHFPFLWASSIHSSVSEHRHYSEAAINSSLKPNWGVQGWTKQRPNRDQTATATVTSLWFSRCMKDSHKKLTMNSNAPSSCMDHLNEDPVVSRINKFCLMLFCLRQYCKKHCCRLTFRIIFAANLMIFCMRKESIILKAVSF